MAHSPAMQLRRVVLVLSLLACGETGRASGPGPSAPALRPTEPVTEPTAEPAATTAPALQIGWDHLPEGPDRSAREANARALRLHGEASGAPEAEARRIYEGSLAAFESVAREHPDYLAARFNVACALSRLGRPAETISILSELLAIDLATFAPRLDSDPDLATLSTAPEYAALSALRDALRARFATALSEGLPVVHVTPLEIIPAQSEDAEPTHRQTFQAGVWLASERRFVPLAPRIVRETDAQVARLALTATFVDRDRSAVLSFEGMGTWSEGGGPIESGTLTVYGPGDGAVRATVSSGRGGLAWVPDIEAYASPTGFQLRYTSETEEDYAPRATSGFAEDVFPRLHVTLAHAGVWWPAEPGPEGALVRGDTIVFGETQVALPGAHRFRRGPRVVRWARRDENSHWLLTAGLVDVEWGEMDPGAVALSIVRFADGGATVELVRSEATGLGMLLRAPDGQLYAQVGSEVFALPSTGAPEALPRGLVLVPTTPARYERR